MQDQDGQIINVMFVLIYVFWMVKLNNTIAIFHIKFMFAFRKSLFPTLFFQAQGEFCMRVWSDLYQTRLGKKLDEWMDDCCQHWEISTNNSSWDLQVSYVILFDMFPHNLIFFMFFKFHDKLFSSLIGIPKIICSSLSYGHIV